ncbi:sigma-70 family RNA polymerase sigma factor [Paenibacillus larvae]
MGGNNIDQWICLLQNNIGDLEADLQELIYLSFYKFAYQYIYFLIRDHATTEDIIQDAFIKIMKHGLNLLASNLRSWVKQVIRNTALDWLRKNKKVKYMFNEEYFNTAAHFQREPSDIENDVEHKLRNELLHQTINELKSEYRCLLWLYYMEEKSYKEICHELNLSEQVVAQRLARARKKLLQHFSRKWINQNT